MIYVASFFSDSEARAPPQMFDWQSWSLNTHDFKAPKYQNNYYFVQSHGGHSKKYNCVVSSERGLKVITDVEMHYIKTDNLRRHLPRFFIEKNSQIFFQVISNASLNPKG